MGIPIDRSKLVCHLLWHFLPVAINRGRVWKRYAQRIRDNIHRFNGRIVIAVITPGRADPWPLARVEEVISEFKGITGIEFLQFPNDRTRGEGVSFIGMMKRVKTNDPNHVVFYGHNKGVTHDDSDDSPTVLWAEAMWETVIENSDEVIDVLGQKALAGSFISMDPVIELDAKTTGAFYAGTFFAVRAHEVFARDWKRLAPQYGCVEVWPAVVFDAHEAGTLFHVPSGDLYDIQFWKERVTPDLKEWRMTRAAWRASERSGLKSSPALAENVVRLNGNKLDTRIECPRTDEAQRVFQVFPEVI